MPQTVFQQAKITSMSHRLARVTPGRGNVWFHDALRSTWSTAGSSSATLPGNTDRRSDAALSDPWRLDN